MIGGTKRLVDLTGCGVRLFIDRTDRSLSTLLPSRAMARFAPDTVASFELESEGHSLGHPASNVALLLLIATTLQQSSLRSVVSLCVSSWSVHGDWNAEWPG